MENYRIKQWGVVAVIGVLVLGLLVGLLHKPGNSATLDQVNYTESVSGVSGIFYANKGLEVPSTGPVFVNSTALSDLMSSTEYSDTLTSLKQFVNTQSHFESRDPVIANVHQKNNQILFGLFIDSNEQFYDVSLKFTSQKVPILTYEADEHEKI
jgi:hypothetical protein